MKTKFKVFGLIDINFLTNVSLNSGFGMADISDRSEMVVARKHLGSFESEIDAIQFVFDNRFELEFEHGFEIVKTLCKK